jgi:glycosyltransferase involved in cell wall biosynthesis
MKVALISRSSLYKVRGGDTTQISRTGDELNKLGVQTDIKLANEQIDYGEYDLLHFFNLIRPADHLYHIRKSGKPYVLSTIYLDYTQFDRKGRPFFYRNLFRALGKHPSELFKNCYRYYKKQDKLVTYSYLKGHLKAMKQVVKDAALLLPNSHTEYDRVYNDLGIEKDYVVVPNGIDPGVFGKIPIGITRKDTVCCVGQIYGMKNQLKLIKACAELKVPVKLIGKSPPNHKKYYQQCHQIKNSTAEFVEFMPQTELLKFYAGSRVHALPSWFETTGLSSLEAGAMGCNLVVGTGGDTKEYFEGHASFCDAADQQSIEQAVEEALNKPLSTDFRDIILERYTWKRAAEKTLEAYEKALKF